MKFQGSFPALITPFYHNDMINFSDLSRLLEMHTRYSDGLVVLGSTGEGWLLSDKEQKQVVDQVTTGFQGPVIINMSCWSPKHFLEKIKLFDTAIDKAHAFLLAAPPYLKLSSYQVIAFYEECARLSPLPIIAYHIPSRNGVAFDNLVFEFLGAETNIIGVKETVASQLQNYGSQYRLSLFAGEDSFLSEPFIDTSINVGGNLFPDIFAACPEQINWAKWQHLMSLANNPLVIKELMFQQNLLSFSGSRLPLGTLPTPICDQISTFDIKELLITPSAAVIS